MNRQHVTLVNNAPVLTLSAELLKELGVSIGDEMELGVENGALVARPLSEIERRLKMDGAMEQLMAKRAEVYERLAEGAK